MAGHEQLEPNRCFRPGLSLTLLSICYLFMSPGVASAGEPHRPSPAKEDIRAEGVYIPEGFPTDSVPEFPNLSEERKRSAVVVPSDRLGDGPLVKLLDGRVVDHAGNVVRVERPPSWDGISLLSIMVGYGAAVLGLAGIALMRRHRRPPRSLLA